MYVEFVDERQRKSQVKNLKQSLESKNLDYNAIEIQSPY